VGLDAARLVAIVGELAEDPGPEPMDSIGDLSQAWNAPPVESVDHVGRAPRRVHPHAGDDNEPDTSHGPLAVIEGLFAGGHMVFPAKCRLVRQHHDAVADLDIPDPDGGEEVRVFLGNHSFSSLMKLNGNGLPLYIYLLNEYSWRPPSRRTRWTRDPTSRDGIPDTVRFCSTTCRLVVGLIGQLKVTRDYSVMTSNINHFHLILVVSIPMSQLSPATFFREDIGPAFVSAG